MSCKRCQESLFPKGVMKNVVFIIMFLSCSFFSVSNARKLAENSGDDGQVGSLIAFKKSSIEYDPKGFLNVWTLSSSSPCTRNGISCSNGGEVVELNLSNAGLSGPLHLTNLMALPTLLRVYFNGNLFSTASSCSFEFLDLSSNNFSDTLVLEPLLKSCDGLKYLNVSRNSIQGVVLKFGPSLLQLDLSSNTISDFGILSYALSNCQNLNLLNFSSNKLAGKLKNSIFSCKSLSVLDLSRNNLTGELNGLDLSRNNLTGELNGLDFGTCQNLTALNLSFNNLSSTEFPVFPPSLANCQSLNTLDIGHNSIKMKIPGELLVKLKSLKRLVLAHNQFLDQIPSELGQTCSTLEELDLSGNRLTGELPSTFKSCSSLISLNLGNNELSGDLLSTVISSLTILRYLYLPFNNITGHVPKSLVNCTQLQVLDLSSNAFIGNVPSEFCLSASRFPLETMLLACNYLTGKLPTQLGLCRNLRKIDLSFNNLTG
ncbi:hypothetical protein K7X08_012385 [Anisodus acutangulus]|uniref:Leucine-rich repeat-containing N-terminal plant-type domain-containing protein n=1 Tax=Anisodus acutangulus TaxID=402998 RepID=A0A9Q1QYL5_9SOLA|nr:hypothetical protein K7X08_012385 [Anisodus acutangulus]